MNDRAPEALASPYRSGRFGGGAAALRPGGAELTRRAVERAGFTAGARILDLGCGAGQGTRVLRAMGLAALGVDLTAEALASAAALLPGVALLAANAERLPFADASFDGIVAECSLSLVERRGDALAECLRVLRRGARLAITDVFARSEASDDAVLPTCLRGLARRDEIVAEITQAGFTVELWEDHSPLLRSFIARLILESDEQSGLNALWCGDDEALGLALRQRRPGYYLLIARRTGEEN